MTSEGRVYSPLIGPMRKGESRYTDLPLLARCGHCRSPLDWTEEAAVVSDGKVHDPVCYACASALWLRKRVRLMPDERVRPDRHGCAGYGHVGGDRLRYVVRCWCGWQTTPRTTYERGVAALAVHLSESARVQPAEKVSAPSAHTEP